MPESLVRALTRVRGHVLDDGSLLRAVAAGRQRGTTPRWRRAEVRYVDLKAGRHLQVTTYDQTQAHTVNHPLGGPSRTAVEALLDEPFGSWHVETVDQSVQVRVTKKQDAMVHVRDRVAPLGDPGIAPAGSALVPEPVEGRLLDPQRAERGWKPPTYEHDRRKVRLLSEDDPVLVGLGISDDKGRVKPSRQAKYRQVEEFLRALEAALDDASLRTPTPAEPWRVVDLGCGNAYLTFAAHRYLTSVRGLPVHLTGVDVKAQSRTRNASLAESLDVVGSLTFVQASIGVGAVPEPPDIVLALHACDTATDDALAAAVGWNAPLVLAAPCCHHDVAAQLRRSPTPTPYALLTRYGILRERFADTLTDAVRAAVLRVVGYRVEVAEFVESKHTPRNTLLRAWRNGGGTPTDVRNELEQLLSTWQVRPRLVELLSDQLEGPPSG